jgi:hypothetical protein
MGIVTTELVYKLQQRPFVSKFGRMRMEVNPPLISLWRVTNELKRLGAPRIILSDVVEVELLKMQVSNRFFDLIDSSLKPSLGELISQLLTR